MENAAVPARWSHATWPQRAIRRGRPAVVLTVPVAVALGCAVSSRARQAAGQTWPPFALVTGLLLIGVATNADGVFAAAADRLSGIRVGTRGLFLLVMGLVAAVTVVLTLDTAVVFLTPILVAVARRRQVDESAFLYGCVFMSNAASLLLPGSNLTNLLVLEHEHVSGGVFAVRMVLPWAAAVAATTVIVAVAHRRALAVPSGPNAERSSVSSPVSVVAATGAIACVLVLRSPALPVLGLGVSLVALYIACGRLNRHTMAKSVDVALLGVLFAATMALGTLARTWGTPSRLIGSATRPTTMLVGALAANLLNNLPATVLLASNSPAHPRALLIGLNIGPNLAVTGSLAAILWLQVGRAAGAQPSARRFTAIGITLVPLTLLAAYTALLLSASPN